MANLDDIIYAVTHIVNEKQ